MKKGFTLIELLAVIVILAIIALIATPIVLNIINDSKESSVLRSADFYLDGVEYAVAQSTLESKTIEDGTYDIVENGNICLEYDTDNKCKNILKIDVDGEVPNVGTVIIESGKITEVTLTFDTNTIIMNSKGNLVFDDVTLANYIKNLYKETKTTTVNSIEYSLDETHGLMNDRLGSSDVAKTDGNIRYYGANPDNYIDIGDRDSEGNIIFWRIIGLFKDVEVTDKDGNVVKTEDLIKIIRSDFLISDDVSGLSYYYTSPDEYSNDWNDSTLQMMLNDAYYNSETTNYYNYESPQVTLNFKSTGLSSSTHNKIARVKWSLGGHTGDEAYTDAIYGYERLGDNSWSGKVALMYPSDYGYSADLTDCKVVLKKYNDETCTSENWLYDSTKHQWTLTRHSNSVTNLFYVYRIGNLYHGNVTNKHSVRPVLYLKSNISIKEEKETKEGLKYLVLE